MKLWGCVGSKIGKLLSGGVPCSCWEFCGCESIISDPFFVVSFGFGETAAVWFEEVDRVIGMGKEHWSPVGAFPRFRSAAC